MRRGQGNNVAVTIAICYTSSRSV